MQESEVPWWRESVFYQIYPRSFADANGDGVGDLAGVTSRLDHIVGLGVDALWLSPIYHSPMADFGYDISDHTAVDPVFGTIEDLDALVHAAHQHDLRVTLDWVPNHTSDRHPWFESSRSDHTSPHRDWYVWRDEPPNQWGGAWNRPTAWTHDPTRDQWYLHLFLAEQPDLNWHHPDVEAAMHDVLRFWLDRGVDGFRADVVHLIGKDPDRRGDPPGEWPLIDEPFTHELLRGVRDVLDAYDHEPMMVGEVYLPHELVPAYLGGDDELHLAFNFAPIHSEWDADSLRTRIEEVHAEYGDRWPTWTLGNHDQPRQATRLGSAARARAAAFFTLGLRGTPYLYAGEELGLPDADIPGDRVVDPGGRDGCRAPVPWTADAPHGWGADTWLPFVGDAGELSAEHQAADPDSTLACYRRLLATRRRSAALRRGHEELLDVADGVVAWERTTGDERVVVAVNCTDAEVPLDIDGVIAVGTHRHREGSTCDGHLLPDEAAVIRP